MHEGDGDTVHLLDDASFGSAVGGGVASALLQGADAARGDTAACKERAGAGAWAASSSFSSGGSTTVGEQAPEQQLRLPQQVVKNQATAAASPAALTVQTNAMQPVSSVKSAGSHNASPSAAASGNLCAWCRFHNARSKSKAKSGFSGRNRTIDNLLAGPSRHKATSASQEDMTFGIDIEEVEASSPISVQSGAGSAGLGVGVGVGGAAVGGLSRSKLSASAPVALNSMAGGDESPSEVRTPVVVPSTRCINCKRELKASPGSSPSHSPDVDVARRPFRAAAAAASAGAGRGSTNPLPSTPEVQNRRGTQRMPDFEVDTASAMTSRRSRSGPPALASSCCSCLPACRVQ